MSLRLTLYDFIEPAMQRAMRRIDVMLTQFSGFDFFPSETSSLTAAELACLTLDSSRDVFWADWVEIPCPGYILPFIPAALGSRRRNRRLTPPRSAKDG